MAWVVDTSIVVDLVTGDPFFEPQVKRRQLQVVKRPVADVLIAAFAGRFQGIITRNATDFRNILPTLQIIEP